MRRFVVLSLLILAPVLCTFGSGRASPDSDGQPLTLIPTAIKELSELRIDSGGKAVLADGEMSDVYVKNLPAEGHVFLNFHVDLATGGGQVLLHKREIRLEAAPSSTSEARVENTKTESAALPGEPMFYTPLDWFLDTGKVENHDDSLTVTEKAIVQFTIEVPRIGIDDLTLFIHSQRVGTVGEIRDRIARDVGSR